MTTKKQRAPFSARSRKISKTIPVSDLSPGTFPSIRIDLDKKRHVSSIVDNCGQTILLIEVIENGKKVNAFVSARISGDSRAGSQSGVHLTMNIVTKKSDVSVERHADPRRGWAVHADE